VITDGVDEHSRLDQLIDLVRSQRAQLFLIGLPSRPEFRFFDHFEPKVTLVTGHDIDNPDVVFYRLAKEAGAETFNSEVGKRITRRAESRFKSAGIGIHTGVLPAEDLAQIAKDRSQCGPARRASAYDPLHRSESGCSRAAPRRPTNVAARQASV